MIGASSVKHAKSSALFHFYTFFLAASHGRGRRDPLVLLTARHQHPLRLGRLTGAPRVSPAPPRPLPPTPLHGRRPQSAGGGGGGAADLGDEDAAELLPYEAVDEKVDGGVESDEEVGDGVDEEKVLVYPTLVELASVTNALEILNTACTQQSILMQCQFVYKILYYILFRI